MTDKEWTRLISTEHLCDMCQSACIDPVPDADWAMFVTVGPNPRQSSIIHAVCDECMEMLIKS